VTDPKSSDPEIAAGVTLAVIAVAILFVSLWIMTKIMRRALAGRVEGALDKTIGRAPILGLIVGIVLTVAVQSSSATTSILVPLAAAGILTVEQVFPITLGANIGTTVTAILAALAGTPAGLTIALAHLLFNITGIVLIYPFRPVRQVPIKLARWLGGLAVKSKWYALAYVAGTFFAIPGLLVWIASLF
jgi:sodium-dependent phosphate cotransporter